MAIEIGNKTATVARTPKRRVRRGRLTAKHRMFMTEQLALLLDTGSNLHEALQTIRRQTTEPAMIDMINMLIRDITEGRTFAQALARHPAMFSQTYVNLIGASEKGGFVHEVLEQLLEMEQKREELKRILWAAFSYPLFLLVFSVFVVVFILMVVFPRFGSLFARIEDQLPVTTLALMRAADFLGAYWPHLLLSCTAAAVLLVQWCKQPSGKHWLHTLQLHTPFLGDIMMQVYVIRLMRVMSVSLGNGVSVLDTLGACREVVANRRFQNIIMNVETQVREGAGIAAGFRSSQLVPDIVRQMVATGEQTGSLPRVMQRVATYYENELARRLAAMARIIEPVMLLVMGAVVGIIVSSLMLPIFKLSRAVSG
ncbi:MAG: type II secretion system F family protein [Gammaproteobacteria bacterium]